MGQVQILTNGPRQEDPDIESKLRMIQALQQIGGTFGKQKMLKDAQAAEELSKSNDFQRQMRLQQAMGQIGGLKTGQITPAQEGTFGMGGRPASVGAIPIDTHETGDSNIGQQFNSETEKNANYMPLDTGTLIDPAQNNALQNNKEASSEARTLRLLGEKLKLEKQNKNEITPGGVSISYDENGNPKASDIPFDNGSTMRSQQEAQQERLRKIQNDETLSTEERRLARDKELKNIEFENNKALEGIRQTGRETLADRIKESKNEKPSPADVSFDTNVSVIKDKISELRDVIKNHGNYENPITGNSDAKAKLSSLPYQIAIPYAKLVDPASVAREGEVAAAEKYLVPLGLFTRNGVSLAALDNLEKTVGQYESARNIASGKSSIGGPSQGFGAQSDGGSQSKLSSLINKYK